MAFKRANLDPNASGSSGIARGIYKTDDTIATVTANGYFDAEWALLQNVKALLVLAADGNQEYSLAVSKNDVNLSVLIPPTGGAEPVINPGTTAQFWRGDKTWQDFSLAARSALLPYLGVADGFASLDSGGKVPAAQLPSYVDDVLEFANLAAFPATGSTGVIYVADATGKIYRWSGSAYVEISPSPGSTDSVTEGSTNLYFTVGRVLASVLTGFSAAPNSVVVAADTVLAAFGKVQAQINSVISNALSVVLTGISFASSATITSADSIISAFGKLQAQITGLSTSKLDASANAVSATKLVTARNINGVAFDGSANITVVDSAALPKTGGTLTGALSATGLTANGNLTATGSLQVGGFTVMQNGLYLDGDSITLDPSIYFRDTPGSLARWRITKNATKDLAFSRYDASGVIIDTPALFGAGGISSFSQIALGTALSIANGGTGGATQAAARTGLGLSAAATMNASVSNAWTPQLQFGAANVGMTATAVGTYTRIGSLVFIKARITLTAKGSSTGVATIAGLPVAAAAENQAVSIAAYANLASITAPFGQILSASSAIGLLQHGAAAPANMSDANFTNTSVIVISGVYDIAAL